MDYFLGVDAEPVGAAVVDVVSAAPTPSSSGGGFLGPGVVFPFCVLGSVVTNTVAVTVAVTVVVVVNVDVLIPTSSPGFGTGDLLSSGTSSSSFSDVSRAPLLPL